MDVKPACDFALEAFLATTIGVLPAALWSDVQQSHSNFLFGTVTDVRSPEPPEAWLPHGLEQEYSNAPEAVGDFAVLRVNSMSTGDHLVSPAVGSVGLTGYAPRLITSTF
jgi:hypothetical protein